ncbi:Retrovirus-related Pol polyprotein from transposon TNT 1-94 [Sesamum angolense]|uniref:Retrovirus-related Pol polyprotein from transposon TNT 1-94 n=1 Tax=Sesamum angolense TaxID=2727404 RepID=A0AAE1W2N5_9LAMI|nr:Retrovirus-related Pol polyprotein from transposon TNT 1-94 [Sesamum angolense]
MTGDKSTMDQVHEYENLVAEVLSEGKIDYNLKGRNSKKEGNKGLSKETMEGSTKSKSQTTISAKTTNQSNRTRRSHCGSGGVDSSICESRDAEFFEQEFPLIDSHNSHKVSNPSRTPMIPSTTELRRSKRQKTETSFGPDFLIIFLAEDIDRIDDHLVSAFFVDEDPKTYIEAVTSVDSSFWKEAIKNELDSIMENHTWDLVDLPRGSKPIKCKWVFKKKIRPGGSIDKFKARLVVVGYTQRKEGFCDVNWVTDNDEVSSTSGYVFTLGGGAISWKSVKQTCIARSTMESEFIALELAGLEAEWLRNLVGDMPMWGSSIPVSIHCDSQPAIGIAKNYAYNGKRRQIRIKHGAIKELLKNGIISLEYVRSERNLADPLTKGLTRRIILETSRAMGLKP